MTVTFRKLANVAALAGLMLTTPAQAASKCWDNDVNAAAQVQEFKLLLMNVSLRCRVIEVDTSANFDRMVKTHARTFDEAERKLRDFFGAKASRASQTEYLRYNTILGNMYGGGNTNIRNCNVFNGVMTELSVAGDNREALVGVASAMIATPRVEGSRCNP